MRHLVRAAIAAALVSTACGGSQAPSDSTAPSEDVTPVQPLADEPSADETAGEEVLEEEPPASGPGQLRVVNRVAGEEAGGNVRVVTPSGEVVAEGRSGETFTVESGEYVIVGEITDANVLIDKPTREADRMVTVVAGEEQTAAVEHPRARVRFRVTRRGRPVAQWRMTVRRQGVEESAPIELRSRDEHVPITPGRYDGTLRFGTQEIAVNGLIFQGGATMDLPVNVD